VLKISTTEGSCNVTLKGRTINIYKIEENTKSFVYKNILNQRKRVRERKRTLSTDSLKRKIAQTENRRITAKTKTFFLLKNLFINQF
jgi:hypothetical protein